MSEGLIQGHHAMLGAGLDHGGDLVSLPLPDGVAHRGDGDERFEGHHPPSAIGAADEDLRDHPEQVHRELHADLLLLVGGEDIDHAVHGLDGVGGVQGSDD